MFIANFSVVITEPFNSKSYIFSERNISLKGFKGLSATTKNATFQSWRIGLTVGPGAYKKAVLPPQGPNSLCGIGLFKMCLVNLDPNGTIFYSGLLELPSTLYDCNIPTDGSFQLTKQPTGQPTSVPTIPDPTSHPTSMPTYEYKNYGEIVFNADIKCDKSVGATFIGRDYDFLYMRAACDTIPGYGSTGVFNFQAAFDSASVLNTGMLYRCL